MTMPESVSDPTTTAEENRHTAGRRQINLVWEYTQAAIALLVSTAALAVAAALALRTADGGAAVGLLANAFFLIIGFYFGRTNHARDGWMRPLG